MKEKLKFTQIFNQKKGKFGFEKKEKKKKLTNTR